MSLRKMDATVCIVARVHKFHKKPTPAPKRRRNLTGKKNLGISKSIKKLDYGY